MQKYQFTSIDTILAKYARDFRGLGINEGDAIEWIGEALGHMKMVGASDEYVTFLEVKNYQAPLPNGLHYIIQIARNNKWVKEGPVACTPEVIVAETKAECEDCGSNLIAVDCHGIPIGDDEQSYYTPYFNLQYEYLQWARSSYYRNDWTPVRLANASFFDSLVCHVVDNEVNKVYNGSNERDEYTIVQNQLRFNFKEGFVAVACVGQKVDCNTGYPMIPDDESAKKAITYYLAWMVKQREAYLHREGAMALAENAEAHYLKYIKQFKNKTKMPYGTDQYQNLMDAGNYLIPKRNRYYGFFGNLAHAEERPFNNPGNYD